MKIHIHTNDAKPTTKDCGCGEANDHDWGTREGRAKAGESPRDAIRRLDREIDAAEKAGNRALVNKLQAEQKRLTQDTGRHIYIHA